MSRSSAQDIELKATSERLSLAVDARIRAVADEASAKGGYGLVKKIEDAFSTTEVEIRVQEARKVEAIAREDARISTISWLHQRVPELIAQDPVLATHIATLTDEHRASERSHMAIAEIHERSSAVVNELTDIETLIEKALNAEGTDLLVGGTAVAWWSRARTEKVAERLYALPKTIKAFADLATEKNIGGSGLAFPDIRFEGLSNFWLDALIDPLNIYYSWENMEQLRSAQGACRKTMLSLFPVHDRLTSMLVRLDLELARLSNALYEAETPCLNIALSELPENLSEFALAYRRPATAGPAPSESSSRNPEGTKPAKQRTTPPPSPSRWRRRGPG